MSFVTICLSKIKSSLVVSFEEKSVNKKNDRSVSNELRYARNGNDIGKSGNGFLSNVQEILNETCISSRDRSSVCVLKKKSNSIVDNGKCSSSFMESSTILESTQSKSFLILLNHKNSPAEIKDRQQIEIDYEIEMLAARSLDANDSCYLIHSKRENKNSVIRKQSSATPQSMLPSYLDSSLSIPHAIDDTNFSEEENNREDIEEHVRVLCHRLLNLDSDVGRIFLKFMFHLSSSTPSPSSSTVEKFHSRQDISTKPILMNSMTFGSQPIDKNLLALLPSHTAPPSSLTSLTNFSNEKSLTTSKKQLNYKNRLFGSLIRPRGHYDPSFHELNFSIRLPKLEINNCVNQEEKEHGSENETTTKYPLGILRQHQLDIEKDFSLLPNEHNKNIELKPTDTKETIKSVFIGDRESETESSILKHITNNDLCKYCLSAMYACPSILFDFSRHCDKSNSKYYSSISTNRKTLDDISSNSTSSLLYINKDILDEFAKAGTHYLRIKEILTKINTSTFYDYKCTRVNKTSLMSATNNKDNNSEIDSAILRACQYAIQNWLDLYHTSLITLIEDELSSNRDNCTLLYFRHKTSRLRKDISFLNQISSSILLSFTSQKTNQDPTPIKVLDYLYNLCIFLQFNFINVPPTCLPMQSPILLSMTAKSRNFTIKGIVHLDLELKYESEKEMKNVIDRAISDEECDFLIVKKIFVTMFQPLLTMISKWIFSTHERDFLDIPRKHQQYSQILLAKSNIKYKSGKYDDFYEYCSMILYFQHVLCKKEKEFPSSEERKWIEKEVARLSLPDFFPDELKMNIFQSKFLLDLLDKQKQQRPPHENSIRNHQLSPGTGADSQNLLLSFSSSSLSTSSAPLLSFDIEMEQRVLFHRREQLNDYNHFLYTSQHKNENSLEIENQTGNLGSNTIERQESDPANNSDIDHIILEKDGKNTGVSQQGQESFDEEDILNSSLHTETLSEAITITDAEEDCNTSIQDVEIGTIIPEEEGFQNSSDADSKQKDVEAVKVEKNEDNEMMSKIRQSLQDKYSSLSDEADDRLNTAIWRQLRLKSLPEAQRELEELIEKQQQQEKKMLFEKIESTLSSSMRDQDSSVSTELLPQSATKSKQKKESELEQITNPMKDVTGKLDTSVDEENNINVTKNAFSPEMGQIFDSLDEKNETESVSDGSKDSYLHSEMKINESPPYITKESTTDADDAVFESKDRTESPTTLTESPKLIHGVEIDDESSIVIDGSNLARSDEEINNGIDHKSVTSSSVVSTVIEHEDAQPRDEYIEPMVPQSWLAKEVELHSNVNLSLFDSIFHEKKSNLLEQMKRTDHKPNNMTYSFLSLSVSDKKRKEKLYVDKNNSNNNDRTAFSKNFDRCIVFPIQRHLLEIEDISITYFLQDTSLQKHLLFLRKVCFGEHTMFLNHFTNQFLLGEIQCDSRKWNLLLLNEEHIQRLYNKSLILSDMIMTDNSDYWSDCIHRLSFTIGHSDCEDTTLSNDDVCKPTYFKRLYISYNAPPPINVIVGQISISKYASIQQLLLRHTYSEQIMSQIWSFLNSTQTVGKTQKHAKKVIPHWLHMFRHQIQHKVSMLSQYLSLTLQLSHQRVDPCHLSKKRRSKTNVSSLQDIYSTHLSDLEWLCEVLFIGGCNKGEESNDNDDYHQDFLLEIQSTMDSFYGCIHSLYSTMVLPFKRENKSTDNLTFIVTKSILKEIQSEKYKFEQTLSKLDYTLKQSYSKKRTYNSSSILSLHGLHSLAKDDGNDLLSIACRNLHSLMFH